MIRKTKNNVGYTPKPSNVAKLQTYLSVQPVQQPKQKKKKP